MAPPGRHAQIDILMYGTAFDRVAPTPLPGGRRLEELILGSPEPGGLGGAVLRRVLVASDSLRSIAWRRLPSLEDLTLDCPSLTSLSLTDCDGLTDKVRGRGLGPSDGSEKR